MKPSSIHYTLSFQEPQAHYMEVQINIQFDSPADSKFIDLKMPVWTPGSYLIREYARHLEGFNAKSLKHGNNLLHEKTDKNTWRIMHKGDDFQVSYRLYGFEKTVRTNFFDQDHAFISPASTFLYLAEHKDMACTIEVIPAAHWEKISTGLPPVKGKENIYYADDVDILMDSPIQVGNQTTWTFDAVGIPHELAMVGPGNYNREKLTKDIQKIIEAASRIWPENPNERYVFITHHYKAAYGGLEHLNSTVLAFSRKGYQNLSSYQNFLGLVSHEYFHLWCVKRLRPKELGPFDYSRENYSKALWIMEGFTSYYDNLILRRAGILTEDEYLNVLNKDFNAVLPRPGAKIQSAEMSSFDTWIKHYRQDENAINSQVSYYNKGALLACAMDLNIISNTDGKKRLDDVLKEAYSHFYLNLKRGFTLDEFKHLAEKVGETDLNDIFEAAGNLEELDYATLLSKVGYTLTKDDNESARLTLGIDIRIEEQRVYVKHVRRDTAAWRDGLNVDDEIIAINGERIDHNGKDIPGFVEACKSGESLNFCVAREGLLREIVVKPEANIYAPYLLKKAENRSEKQEKLAEIWLSL